jgi:hypothetical protein
MSAHYSDAESPQREPRKTLKMIPIKPERIYLGDRSAGLYRRIGEHDFRLRASVCQDLGFLGIRLDTNRNEQQ